MCSSLEELYEHVERDQLTEDLGGNIVFDHREWIQQRGVSKTFPFQPKFGHIFFLFSLAIRRYTIPCSLIFDTKIHFSSL